MVGDDLPGKRRRVHARRGLDRETESRLVELGRSLPPPSEDEAKVLASRRSAWKRRRLAFRVVVVVVVVVVAGAMVQWLRPLPVPALEGPSTGIRIPGNAPVLPWPSAGEAAMSVPGLGIVGQSGGTQPVPIGPLSGVLVAYVILKDHPLGTGGATGPTLAVTPQTLASYQSGHAVGQPEVPVTAGESLTELDALEGLLVDSGNDMATLLADWDAGSTSAFVTKMDLNAVSLGLRRTRIAAPGGADDAVVSNPVDLIRLAGAAMQIPVLQQIVSLGEVTLAGAGLHYNPNFVLGEDGVVGVEAGSDSIGNGCYLFAAQKPVGGQTVTLYGAVLGQSGPNGPDTAAVASGDALVRAALPALTAVPVLQAGAVVGQLSTPWGASTPLEVSRAVTIPAWPGLRIPVTTRLSTLTLPVASGSQVGSLQVLQGHRAVTVALHTTEPLRGPSGMWRLTR